MVIDLQTEDVRSGSLMELLYADDLVLCGESLDKLMDRCGRDGKIQLKERVRG